MKRILLYLSLTVSSLLLSFYAFADTPKAPPPLSDVPVLLQQYLKHLYDNLHKLPIITTSPNASRRGDVGELIVRNNVGTYEGWVNTNGATGWSIFASGGGSAYNTVQDEGSALTSRTIINCVGAGVTCSDDGAGSRTTFNVPGATATPAGSDTQIQYNSSGSFGADASLVWNYTNYLFTVAPAALTSVTVERPSISSSARTLTLTDGTTIANQRINQFLAPTISGVAGGGTETVTNSSTVYIEGPPSGSNITLTNPYCLWVDSGSSLFGGDIEFEEGIGIANIRVKNRTTASNGSDLNIYAGDSFGTTQDGGDIVLFAGEVGATNGNGGRVSIETATASGTNKNGGNFNVNLGSPTGSGSGGTMSVARYSSSGNTAEQVVSRFANFTATLSDGSTIANQRTHQFLAPTINGVSGGGIETVTNAATVYIDSAPSGSNITFTNGPYALWVDNGVFRNDGAFDNTGAVTTTGIITVGNKIKTSGSAPTVSSCGGGTPSIVGSDVAGKVTVGTGVVTACTLTFNSTYINAPACFANNDTQILLVQAVPTATTVILNTALTMDEDVVSYFCVGRQ